MEQSQQGGAAASGVLTSLSYSEPLASLLERGPWALGKEQPEVGRAVSFTCYVDSGVLELV